MPFKVFIAYSHRDESYRDELETHVAVLRRQGLMSVWHDRRIPPGTDWDEQITAELEEADVILLLLSPDFLASDYCYSREASRALERHAAGSARVIPIILRHCQWMRTPLANLQALPRDGAPVAGFTDRDEVLVSIANAIADVLEELDQNRRRPVTSAVYGNERYSPTGLVALRANSIWRHRQRPGSMFLLAPDHAVENQSFIAVVLCIDDACNVRGEFDVVLTVDGGYFAPQMEIASSGPTELVVRAPFERGVIKVYPSGSSDIRITATRVDDGYHAEVHVARASYSLEE